MSDDTVNKTLYRLELHIAIAGNLYTLKKGFYTDSYELIEPTIGFYVKDFPCSSEQTIDEIITKVIAYVLKTNGETQT